MCNTELIALCAGTLVFISEALPFLKKYESNGILHAVICILKSDCIKDHGDEASIADVEIVVMSDSDSSYNSDKYSSNSENSEY